jgi:hypothetical protein
VRRLTALLVVTALVHLAPVATATAQERDCASNSDGFGGVVAVGCNGGEQGGGGKGGGYTGPLVTAVSSVDGQTCTIQASPTSDQGAEALALENGLQSLPFIGNLLSALWDFIVAGLPGCPGGIVTPRDVAFSFVRTMPPPDTGPSIAPGHAITGKPAYLQQATTQATQTFATVLGPLTITLQATDFTVDWGDGSATDNGPFASPGGAWPDGQAKHTYTKAQKRDVVISQRWVAHWEIPGVDAGDINGVRSTDTIAGFDVRQLQAVRDK